MSIPFYRRLLGDRAVVQVATGDKAYLAEAERLFPEAAVMVDATTGFPDR